LWLSVFAICVLSLVNWIVVVYHVHGMSGGASHSVLYFLQGAPERAHNARSFQFLRNGLLTTSEYLTEVLILYASSTTSKELIIFLCEHWPNSLLLLLYCALFPEVAMESTGFYFFSNCMFCLFFNHRHHHHHHWLTFQRRKTSRPFFSHWRKTLRKLQGRVFFINKWLL